MNYNTLNEALLARANNDLFVNFINGVHDESQLSYQQLHQRALEWLHYFQQQGLKTGDELIFFLKDNQVFVEAFWACLLGGIVPVPVAVGISDEHRSKLIRIFKRLENPHLLIDRKAADLLQAYADGNDLQDEHKVIAAKTLLTEKFVSSGKSGETYTPNKDDIAFIQFSSGSTRDPKGVVLTHENLVTTVVDLGNRAEYSESDIALSWMPLTHDLGLIGFHINMLVFGISHHIMATDLFSRRPLVWMQKASEKRATLLSSPNFGYKHYLKVYHTRSDHQLDLSCIRMILNGAEPISVTLCDEFHDTMSKHGLPNSAIYTCYGLAEAALAVALPKTGVPFEYITVDRNSMVIGQAVKHVEADNPQAVRYVIEGPPVERCAVRIGDETGKDFGEETIGEVQLKGPNVTSGYYNDPESNQDLFTPDGWLRTGDLALLHQGRLVITGRLKDIIFANGLNYYPHDLEAVALQIPELELGKVVALGVRTPEADHDDILVCVLYRGELDAFIPLVKQIKQLINEHIGVEVSHVLPVKRVPKTTSGKVQRRFFAQAYLEHEYEPVIEQLHQLLEQSKATASASTVSGQLGEITRIFQQALPDKSIEAEDNFFEIGLSSLDLATFQEQLDEQFPGLIDITDMFDYSTLKALAELVDQRLTEAQAN